MDVEIKDTQGCDLPDLPVFTPDEQFARADFDQSDHCIGRLVHSQVQTLVISEKTKRGCDSLRKLLGF